LGNCVKPGNNSVEKR